MTYILAYNQRVDCVVEIIEAFLDDVARSNPSASILFFRDLDNFK